MNTSMFSIRDMIFFSVIGPMWIYLSRNGLTRIQPLINKIKNWSMSKGKLVCKNVYYTLFCRRFMGMKVISKRQERLIFKLKPYNSYIYSNGQYIRYGKIKLATNIYRNEA